MKPRTFGDGDRRGTPNGMECPKCGEDVLERPVPRTIGGKQPRIHLRCSLCDWSAFREQS